MVHDFALPGMSTLNRHGRGRGRVARTQDRQKQLFVTLMLTRCLLTSCFLTTGLPGRQVQAPRKVRVLRRG